MCACRQSHAQSHTHTHAGVDEDPKARLAKQKALLRSQLGLDKVGASGVNLLDDRDLDDGPVQRT